MRKYFREISISAMLMLSATTVFADTTIAPKIAVVDARMVLQKSPQMAVINAQLDKQFKSRQQSIVDAQKKLQADVDKLNKNGSVMKDDERGALQDKIISERANVQGMVSSFQQDLSNAQNQSMQTLMAKFSGVLSKLAESGGYDFVLQKDAVPYFSSKYDITNEALQGMSKAK